MDTPVLLDGETMVWWIVRAISGGFALVFVLLLMSYIAQNKRKG